MTRRTNGYVLSTGGWRSALGAVFDTMFIVRYSINHQSINVLRCSAYYLGNAPADPALRPSSCAWPTSICPRARRSHHPTANRPPRATTARLSRDQVEPGTVALQDVIADPEADLAALQTRKGIVEGPLVAASRAGARGG